MKAIFNREFNSYFTSMLGYVFLTIFLLLTGVMFYVVNIRFMTARMTNFFSIVNNWALFLLPLLTMRLFSEDRKQKTDQLLLSGMPADYGQRMLQPAGPGRYGGALSGGGAHGPGPGAAGGPAGHGL